MPRRDRHLLRWVNDNAFNMWKVLEYTFICIIMPVFCFCINIHWLLKILLIFLTITRFQCSRKYISRKKVVHARWPNHRSVYDLTLGSAPNNTSPRDVLKNKILISNNVEYMPSYYYSVQIYVPVAYIL
jgi:hypothetical protein